MNTVIAQSSVTTTGSVDAGASLVGTVIWLAITVALVVALWKLFVKAGRPGWATLIPIYNTVTLLQITGRSGWWLLGFLVPFLNIFVAIRLVFDLAKVFGRGIGFGFGLLFPGQCRRQSRHQLECVSVGQPVDAKVTVESEHLAQSLVLGECDQGRISEVHRQIAILLHQRRHTREHAGVRFGQYKSAGPDHAPERVLAWPSSVAAE